jgi:hypothetical protein
MNYTVTAIGDDWVDIWDGAAIVDPDIPRHKSTQRVHVGTSHGFRVDDEVNIVLRKVIPTPEDVLADELFQHGGEGALPS